MDLSLAQVLGLSSLGLVVGCISSLFGLGGGVVLVPLLPFILPVEASEAVMLALGCMSIVVAVNLYMFNKKQLVVWSYVFKFGSLAALGGIIASQLAVGLRGEWIRGITVVMLFLL